ncbi:tRNA epoxyqueuosine(34) reductase QueG [Nostoc paludosum FACHB-159]|uniref:Epoxyqueuosine reductase n=2 Tax=Nostoc TaxID=1177 RepID=A0ABR8K1B1_9NOSO|nr:tRNA epoxyqueuosine(34) reductase QueG [Nostoc sp. FACHB-857]MBD2732594.1 tRNA epoxyqueuosine(34) reductase QueG [Nostoc paludosum FACHB-159]
MNQCSVTSSSVVKEKASELGFHKIGIAAVDRVDVTEAQRLKAWLALGYHADMEWMSNQKRQDIRLVMPEVRSLVCVALNYYTPHQRPQGEEYGKISRYGWGRDYHKVMHKKLKQLATWLESLDESVRAIYYADTGPVQDKVWAQKAGIGWIAKNGNVITREYGSWVFLGEVLTNLELESDRPHTEHCGSCTRCLEACPTGAITQPFVVDANRCIAYHTIENRAEELPQTLTPYLQGWVAGCDICQDVCPWNQRFAKTTDITEFAPYPQNLAPQLLELAQISDGEWDKRFPASALRRIKPEMLRRNAQANLDAFRRKMTQKVIIFDFDGTIADTVDALVSIANRLAVDFGYIQITPDQLALLKNLTSREIIKYSGVSLFKIPFLVKKVKGELKNKIPELKPIPGIKEALIQLQAQGYKLGIITSNSKENVTEFLKINDLNYLFDFIYSGITIFGKTTIINNVLKQKQLKPQDVIYVGDETRDIEASKKANIQVIAVTWGFNSPEVLAKQNPDYLIHRPSELLEVMK